MTRRAQYHTEIVDDVGSTGNLQKFLFYGIMQRILLESNNAELPKIQNYLNCQLIRADEQPGHCNWM